MSAAAIFGAVMSCIFVALWFYRDPMLPQDTAEQKDTAEEIGEPAKEKPQPEKSEQKGKSSKKAAKRKTEVCVDCLEEWRLRSSTPWPDGELRR